MAEVPRLRIREVNHAWVHPRRSFVLYWMVTARRTRWNFALQRAVGWAREFGKSLLVVEHLPCGMPWDSDRTHRFVLNGMADNAARLERSPAACYPFVERSPGEGRDLLRTLAESACVVVTDEFPDRAVRRLTGEVAKGLPCLVEAVDSNGLLPLRAADRAFPTAHSFRRFLHRELPAHLEAFPVVDPLSRIRLPRLRSLPDGVRRRWPRASARLLQGELAALQRLPVDHDVPPVATPGGQTAARAAMNRFLRRRQARYGEDRNHPDLDATSGLAPYLHCGHISAHEVVHRIMAMEGWSAGRLSGDASGQRAGWWGMSPSAEAFLDQLVTWRELGYNMSHRCDEYDRYESLPEWARRTLERHARDRREYRYTLEEFRAARTHDALWNAAQVQLTRQGRLHNYLRMLWGKKILEWSASPREALRTMVELNNCYALDGRDPNSWSGIFWVLGRYDRPWGPERKIFGTVRYMSCDNTRRKVKVRGYLARYAP